MRYAYLGFVLIYVDLLFLDFQLCESVGEVADLEDWIGGKVFES